MAKILQVTPHPVFPPRGGRRAFFYLRELAREHEVFAVFPQKLDSLNGEKEGYTFPENIHAHSTLDDPAPATIFDRLPRNLGPSLQYRWLRRSLRGPASSPILDSHHLIEKILRENEIDIAIFDHIQTMMAAPLVRRLSPKTIRVLNAHNVDSTLAQQFVKATEGTPIHAQRLREYQVSHYAETHLADEVDGFWACSEVDRKQLDEMNGGAVPGFDIPNGIAPEVLPIDLRKDKRDSNEILFCGSLNYEPNRRGLEWFRKQIWPRIRESSPDTRLVIVGYGAEPGEYKELREDPAVDFVGEVDNVVQSYHRTSLSIVPLLEGSGTRVKILEAMTLGSPSVSTAIGAEGIDAVNGRDILIEDEPAAFADAVVKLLNDSELYEKIRTNGRELIDTVYDWRVVGRELNKTIEEILTWRRS